MQMLARGAGAGAGNRAPAGKFSMKMRGRLKGLFLNPRAWKSFVSKTPVMIMNCK